jgi:hypothetical protein
MSAPAFPASRALAKGQELQASLLQSPRASFRAAFATTLSPPRAPFRKLLASGVCFSVRAVNAERDEIHSAHGAKRSHVYIQRIRH